MEAALSWMFGPVNCRVPDARHSSFTHPLLPPLLTTNNPHPRPPPGTHACPLPPLSARPRPKSAIVGWRVHNWADHSAFYVVNSRGQRIFVQVWRPLPETPSPQPRRNPLRLLRHVARPFAALWPSARRRRGIPSPAPSKAVVYIVHGLNDHSNKYTRVARAWVAAGYTVIAHDFHGHGRSDGFRAYTSSLHSYVTDARLAIARTDERLPRAVATLPKFLLAHSLGGAVAIHLAREAPAGAFRGVMLTAPAVRVFPKPLLKLFAPVLATLAPLLPVQRLKFDRYGANKKKRRNAAIVPSTDGGGEEGDDDDDAYSPHDDPLVVRSPVRARVGYEVLKSCEKIMSEADRFRLPVFVAHSAHDRVTNAKGTVEFHSRIASSDKTVRLYDGSVHDLLAQKRTLVVGDMIEWASQRLR